MPQQGTRPILWTLTNRLRWSSWEGTVDLPRSLDGAIFTDQGSSCIDNTTLSCTSANLASKELLDGILSCLCPTAWWRPTTSY